jgi:hypothetical protein
MGDESIMAKPLNYAMFKERIKDLKKPIIYEGHKYNEVSDLCVAAGINREVFIWLYLSTDWTMSGVIQMAQSIETIS